MTENHREEGGRKAPLSHSVAEMLARLRVEKERADKLALTRLRRGANRQER